MARCEETSLYMRVRQLQYTIYTVSHAGFYPLFFCGQAGIESVFPGMTVKKETISSRKLENLQDLSTVEHGYPQLLAVYPQLIVKLGLIIVFCGYIFYYQCGKNSIGLQPLFILPDIEGFFDHIQVSIQGI